MSDEQLELRLSEIRGQAEALEFSFVSLVRALGDDALSRTLAEALERKVGHRIIESLQATESFDATLLRVAEELVEPSGI